MTFLKAAESVLKETERPMRPEEIVKVAIEKGWLSSGGKTPEATMHAQIAVHIKKGGKVFVRAMPGFYGLAGTRKSKVSVQPDLFDEAKKDAGYVYILTNPSFRRDWVKIGMTERPVNTRSKELDNTAAPLPFEIYATLKTNHRRKIEHLLHGSIDDIAPKKRIRKTREFFNISPETALKLLVRAAEVFDEEQYIDEVFKHGQTTEKKTPTVKRPSIPSDKNQWHTTRNDIIAGGRYFEDHFEVLPGSQINMAKPAPFAAGDELRKRLLKEGLIVEESPGRFILKAKQSFATPSAASCFVLGGNTNGWIEWKNNDGDPLDLMRKR